VLVTQAFWRRRLGGDPAAVGRVLAGDAGTGVRVVGILPDDFVCPYPLVGLDGPPEMVAPRISGHPPSRGAALVPLVRVPAGESVAAVSSQLADALAREVASRPTPPGMSGLPARRRITSAGYDRIALKPIRGALTEGLADHARAVFAATMVLALLACVNVGGLTAARARDRWRDLVVRRALGARTSDLVALLASESLLIALAAVALGLAGARFVLASVVPLMVGFLPVLKPPVIDIRVVVFAGIAALACGLVVTLLAVRGVARASLVASIGDGGRTTPRERSGFSVVAIELALGVVLTVGGALVAGSFLRVWHEDPGLDPANAAVLEMSAPPGSSGEAIEDLVAAIGRLPGVMSAGGMGYPFLERAVVGDDFDRPAGVPARDVGPGQSTVSVPITGGFFAAIGVRPTDGRMPTDAELATGAAVVVVTEAVAREYWPGRSAVGQTLLRHGRPYVVVGAVPGVRLMSLDMDALGDIFWPLAAAERPYLGNVFVRFSDAAPPALGTVVAYVRRQCAGCWFYGARTLRDALGSSVRSRRFNAWLFVSFGLAAVVIVGAGVLGVVAMATNRRTREIGIRVALGATRAGVIANLVRSQLRPVVAGLAAGMLIAVWATRFVGTYLYKTSAGDPWAWSAGIAAILLIALVAALVPSWRASRVDPVRVLRTE